MADPFQNAALRLRLIAGCFLLCWPLPVSVRAELQPEEVGIVALKGSPDSRHVAEYYAEKWRIPTSQICYVDAPAGETLDRRIWEQKVRPEIRQWILQNRLETKLRCLVTVWDVPLKIGKMPDDDPTRARRAAYLAAEREGRWQQLRQIVSDAKNGPATYEPLPPDDSVLPESLSLDEAEKLIKQALQEAAQRIDKEANGERQKELVNQLEQWVSLVGGTQAVVHELANRPGAETEKTVLLLRGRLSGLQEGLAALASLSSTVQRDEQFLALLQAVGGLTSTIRWIDEQRKVLEANASQASFDSELSLLFWPDYELEGWQPNVWHYQFDGRPERWTKHTLMVARLEAPTLALTRTIIDRAIEVQRTGLEGTFYLDARGIKGTKEPPTGSFEEFDQSLRRLADLLGKYSSQKVVLDDQPSLFQPGSCPDAALYCGWYSVGKYIDAFDWVPGSVGYHIASFEATSIRNSRSQVWCKRMLEDGVCATLGAVNEPYLGAMPRPHEFFVVLLSGQYTLVETFYRTKPYNSWQLTLLGDPLYLPFGRKPGIDVQALPEELKRVVGEGG